MFEPLYKFKLDKSQKRNAKISKEDEEEIKRLYAMGIYSQGYLAKQFGVSQPCVNYIVNEDRRAKKNEEKIDLGRRLCSGFRSRRGRHIRVPDRKDQSRCQHLYRRRSW